jgi:phosphotriesterase-related protein
VSTDELGITLSHEHCLVDVTCDYAEPAEKRRKKISKERVTMHNAMLLRYGIPNLDNMRLDDETLAVRELKRFGDLGGKTIVDATNMEIGRNPEALRRISVATGLNIIMGSGYYTKEVKRTKVVQELSKEKIADHLVEEITKGEKESGIKPGIIGEIGCSWPIDDFEKKVLKAAGIAQRETGAPLYVHPGRGENAPIGIIKMLKEIGTDLGKTAMCHVERTIFNSENRYKLADSGCYLSYDLWGYEGYYLESLSPIDIPNDAERIRQLKDLVGRGHRSQILLSHDIDMKCRYFAYGGHGYGHILQNAIPAMLRRHVSEQDISFFLIENPKRILGFL